MNRTVSIVAAVYGPTLSMIHNGKTVFEDYQSVQKFYIDKCRNTSRVVDVFFSERPPNKSAKVACSNRYIFNPINVLFDMSKTCVNEQTLGLEVDAFMENLLGNEEGDISITTTPKNLSYFMKWADKLEIASVKRDKGQEFQISELIMHLDEFDLEESITDTIEKGDLVSFETWNRITKKESRSDDSELPENPIIKSICNRKEWAILQDDSLIRLDSIVKICPGDGTSNIVEISTNNGGGAIIILIDEKYKMNSSEAVRSLFELIKDKPPSIQFYDAPTTTIGSSVSLL